MPDSPAALLTVNLGTGTPRVAPTGESKIPKDNRSQRKLFSRDGKGLESKVKRVN